MTGNQREKGEKMEQDFDEQIFRCLSGKIGFAGRCHS